MKTTPHSGATSMRLATHCSHTTAGDFRGSFVLRIAAYTCGLDDGAHEQRFANAQLDALICRRQLVQAQVDTLQQVARCQHNHRAEEVA